MHFIKLRIYYRERSRDNYNLNSNQHHQTPLPRPPSNDELHRGDSGHGYAKRDDVRLSNKPVERKPQIGDRDRGSNAGDIRPPLPPTPLPTSSVPPPR